MILTGDCRSLLPRIAPNSVSCAVTSPPFWTGVPIPHTDPREIGGESFTNYTFTLVTVCSQIRRTLTPTGCIWIVLGHEMPWEIITALALDGWHIANAAAWHETVVAHLRQIQRNGIACPMPPYGDALTDRPYRPLAQNFVRFCLDCSSHSGDTVLDPFCGSGTVGLTAQRMQRKFIGIELDDASSQLANARCSHYT